MWGVGEWGGRSSKERLTWGWGGRQGGLAQRMGPGGTGGLAHGALPAPVLRPRPGRASDGEVGGSETRPLKSSCCSAASCVWLFAALWPAAH